jgi:hypothetical protein
MNKKTALKQSCFLLSSLCFFALRLKKQRGGGREIFVINYQRGTLQSPGL